MKPPRSSSGVSWRTTNHGVAIAFPADDEPGRLFAYRLEQRPAGGGPGSDAISAGLQPVLPAMLASACTSGGQTQEVISAFPIGLRHQPLVVLAVLALECI